MGSYRESPRPVVEWGLKASARSIASSPIPSRAALGGCLVRRRRRSRREHDVSTNMGNLEKLGILVIVILVVVVGVVAITPKSTVDERLMQPEVASAAPESGVEPLDQGTAPATDPSKAPADPFPGAVAADQSRLPANSLDPAAAPAETPA